MRLQEHHKFIIWLSAKPDMVYPVPLVLQEDPESSVLSSSKGLEHKAVQRQ